MLERTALSRVPAGRRRAVRAGPPAGVSRSPSTGGAALVAADRRRRRLPVLLIVVIASAGGSDPAPKSTPSDLGVGGSPTIKTPSTDRSKSNNEDRHDRRHERRHRHAEHPAGDRRHRRHHRHAGRAHAAAGRRRRSGPGAHAARARPAPGRGRRRGGEPPGPTVVSSGGRRSRFTSPRRRFDSARRRREAAVGFVARRGRCTASAPSRRPRSRSSASSRLRAWLRVSCATARTTGPEARGDPLALLLGERPRGAHVEHRLHARRGHVRVLAAGSGRAARAQLDLGQRNRRRGARCGADRPWPRDASAARGKLPADARRGRRAHGVVRVRAGAARADARRDRPCRRAPSRSRAAAGPWRPSS